MNQELFINRYRKDWEAFQKMLDALADKKNTESEPVDEFPAAYRRLCKHLALARERQYSVFLVDQLNNLALRAHQYFYKPRDISARGFYRFLAVDFPRSVRRESRLFWLCAAIFYGPLILTAVAIHQQPELVYSLIDPHQVKSFETMYRPDQVADRESGSEIMMFGYYIYNNVSIGFRTFVGGLFAGVGSLFFLLLNGLIIGAITGHLINMGYQETFFSFVSGHGAFELTAIVLAGVAGLKLGRALIAPGLLSRKQALLAAGKSAIPIVYGMMTMLVLAALVEAFWSPLKLPPIQKYLVGGFFWFLVTVYFTLAGRTDEN